jgi:hypothetical protein
MNKNIVLGLVGVVIIIMAGYFLLNDDTDNEKKVVVEDKMELVVNDEFGNFSQFFKTNLTEEEEKNLEDILARLEEKKEEALKVLEEAFTNDNGDMGIAFETANSIAEEIKAELLLFVDMDKSLEFEEA